MLRCKECDFEDRKDLVPHIESEHDLGEYMKKHFNNLIRWMKGEVKIGKEI